MEEDETGERGKMLTYYRRRKRECEIREILTYYRRRKRGSNGEGSSEREEVVHQSSNNWEIERDGVPVSVKEERSVKKESAIDWYLDEIDNQSRHFLSIMLDEPVVASVHAL